MIEHLKRYRANLKSRGQLIQADAVGRCIMLSGDMLLCREKMVRYRSNLVSLGEMGAAHAVARCLQIETDMRKEIFEEVQPRMERCRA